MKISEKALHAATLASINYNEENARYFDPQAAVAGVGQEEWSETAREMLDVLREAAPHIVRDNPDEGRTLKRLYEAVTAQITGQACALAELLDAWHEARIIVEKRFPNKPQTKQ